MTYQIIATLGPATNTERMWRRLSEAGATGFRLNTSHIRAEELETWLKRLSLFLGTSAGREPDAGFPVILDLQASKWRVGAVETTPLEVGRIVDLVLPAGVGVAGPTGGVAADPGVKGADFWLPVPHPDFFAAAASCQGQIAANDAKVLLRIQSSEEERIRACVIQGGEISTGKGITLIGSAYRREQLSAKDLRIVELGEGYPFVRYALSYVKDAVEMDNYRDLFAPSAYLIAKLERASALQDARRIAGKAAELWVCRGDLGAEMGMRDMAEQMLRFSESVTSLGKPTLLAGQVLEHMSEHPTPTRSEISYLYDSLQRGFGGVVLSDETAIGRYPVESCCVAALFNSDQAT